ncbi:MAG: hypothetical protein CL610_14010 [Anaerolineaceae bacterium]|nr:hypothetical protein [Anaerolineaceae bacterium]
MMANWLLYGYGYTGQLLAEEAVRRGHRPVLAGRSEAKLAPLAQRLGLDYRVFSLDDVGSVARSIADMELVFHAAGPYVYTGEPMMQACLQAGAHYLDLTGEIPVFETSFGYDAAARQKNVALICGVGYDVVPTSCLAQYVAEQVPQATDLEIGIHGLSGISAGTAKSAIAGGVKGGAIRKNGELQPYPLGAGVRRIRFSDGEHTVMPIPWGDLAAAYRATRIPNITTYMTIAPLTAALTRVIMPVAQRLMGFGPVQQVLNAAADRAFKGPTEQQRQTSRSYLWARAADAAGHSAEAWLEIPEAYQFTMLAGLQAVEHTLADHPVGAVTPAMAFGADFVLEIDGVQRFDHLPAISKS